MNKTSKIIIFTLLGMVAIWGCTHKISPNNNPIISENCSADTVYFVNDILPILNSNCAMSGCHDAATHKDGVILDSYSNILNTVEIVKGNASESELYKVMISNDPDKVMPESGKLPQYMLDKIQTWINQGAKNNSCGSCDTSQEVKYSSQITTIISQNCKGCHNINNAGGGVNLDNYADVKANVDNGKLLGSIEWTSGFSPMPKNLSKLDDCKINQIKKWINNGAQNN